MELSQINRWLFLLRALLFITSFNAYGIEKFNDYPSQILYLMKAGEMDKALHIYQDYSQQIGKHDFQLIQNIALSILDEGARSRDLEIRLMTLFGAGISSNERALYILEDGLSSEQPQLQLIALNFIARYHNDLADEALCHLMASNNLLIRLEAAFQLAIKKHPTAVGQIESLMAKVDEELTPLFPQFYGMIGDPQSIKIMRRLLTHSDEQVRIETVLNAAKFDRDDLLPAIRRLATHHDVAQQETCATALGYMKDESSVGKLTQFSHSPNVSVKLAALHSLYLLGRHETRHEIEKIALTKNIFAISLLGSMPGSELILAELMYDPNIQVRVNAALALLERNDPRCLKMLSDILIPDSRDFLLLKVNSIGKSLFAWKIIPSASQNLKDTPVAFELSLSLREEILTKTFELPEQDFLKLANTLFEIQQNDLIPVLTDLLENLRTPAAIALLKKHQQKIGAPLVRNYCNLALYRLKEPGPYAANLIEWVTKQQKVDMIRFRPLVPWDLRDGNSISNFELTPKETSRLLVEAFESFVTSQDDKGVDLLISLIQNGNLKNKYALVGLLMRATD